MFYLNLGQNFFEKNICFQYLPIKFIRSSFFSFKWKRRRDSLLHTNSCIESGLLLSPWPVFWQTRRVLRLEPLEIQMKTNLYKFLFWISKKESLKISDLSHPQQSLTKCDRFLSNISIFLREKKFKNSFFFFTSEFFLKKVFFKSLGKNKDEKTLI